MIVISIINRLFYHRHRYILSLGIVSDAGRFLVEEDSESFSLIFDSEFTKLYLPEAIDAIMAIIVDMCRLNCGNDFKWKILISNYTDQILIRHRWAMQCQMATCKDKWGNSNVRWKCTGYVIAAALVWTVTLSATVIDWEQHTTEVQTNGYRWTSSYEIGYWDNSLHVDLDVNLFGDHLPDSKRNSWETGAETYWSRPGYNINLDFVDTGYDYRVYISPNIVRSNMTNWDPDYNWRLVAHEIGHMFGLFDEYAGGALDPVNPIVDAYGLMGCLGGSMLDRYYLPFDNWLDGKLSSSESDGGNAPLNPVTEPVTWLLLGIGLIGLAILKR